MDDKSDSSGRRSGASTGRRNRPKAADFADLTPVPLEVVASTSAGSSHSGNAHRPNTRTRASFAGLPGPRRVIIHLSDSEDDEVAAHGTFGMTHHHHTSSQLVAAATIPAVGSPDLLQRKEREIQRMKDLIKEKMRAQAAGKKTTVSAIFYCHFRGISPLFVEHEHLHQHDSRKRRCVHISRPHD